MISNNSDKLEFFLSAGVEAERAKNFVFAIRQYKQALKIDNNNLIALVNLGNCLRHTKNIDAAKTSYEAAIKLAPSSIVAAYNLAALQNASGQAEIALKNYESVVIRQQDFWQASYNCGVICYQLGFLDKAQTYFKHTLKINPNHEESVVNLASLLLQISRPNTEEYNQLQKLLAKKTNSYEIKMLTYRAINSAMNLKFFDLQNCLSEIASSEKQQWDNLNGKDNVFCKGYFTFLNKIFDSDVPKLRDNQTIYHVGDSHCFTFAPMQKCINQFRLPIQPRLTIGAKAFHFSTNDKNSFKSITMHNLWQIPKKSTIIISFGEIDCRIHEGILQYSMKNKLETEAVVEQVIDGYLAFFHKNLQKLQHRVLFTNVPAPTYDGTYSNIINYKRRDLILHYNQYFSSSCEKMGFKELDLYTPTKNKEGFSNFKFHIDSFHIRGNTVKLQSGNNLNF